jgi:uncharacterized repeat protein (TIGR01451 family)
VLASLLTAGSVQAVGVEVAAQRLDLARDPNWASGAFSPAELGQAVVAGWTPAADRRTASAELPGGVGTVRLVAPPSDLVSVKQEGNFVGANHVPVVTMAYKDPTNLNPATVNCRNEIPRPPSPQPVVGYKKSCGQRELAVSFDRPTVDPILWLGTNMFAPVPSPESWYSPCYLTWQDSAVVRVDGSVPGAGRLQLVSTADSVSSFRDGSLTYDFEQGPKVDCSPSIDVPRGYAGIQVRGLVSSVTLSLDHVVRITRLDATGNIVRGTLAQPEYGLTTSADAVDLDVSMLAPSTVIAGGVLEWTIEATDLGPAASHGFIVSGAVPEALSGVSLVDAPEGCVLDGRDLSCAVAPPGWTVNQDAAMATLANLSGGDPSAVGEVLGDGESFGPITLRGTAPVTPGAEIVTTASVSGVDSDLDLTNNTAQTLTTVSAADWSVAKTVTSSGDTTYPSPGDTLTYTVTATSTSGDVADVVLTDDLTAVLAHADLVPGSVRHAVGSEPREQLADPTAQDPVVVAGPTSLSAGSTATLSYSVVVHGDAWSSELANTVTAAGSSSPSTCAAGSPVLAPVCSTSTTTTARLELLKQGEVNGELVGLDGAAFEVVADADGALGEILDALSVAFEIPGIAPGTYWLRETVAPPGHELLATAVRFGVAEDGTVTLSDPASAPQVAVSGGSLTVTDAPTLQMPETGSAGAGRLVTVGLLLLAGAVVVAVILGPRSHPLLLTALRKRRR